MTPLYGLISGASALAFASRVKFDVKMRTTKVADVEASVPKK